MAQSSLEEYKMEETRVYGKSYVLYSREDPHYKDFFRRWLDDEDLRFCLYMAVHTQLSFFDRSVRDIISKIFESRRDNILVMDIRGIYRQCNEDIRLLK